MNYNAGTFRYAIVDEHGNFKPAYEGDDEWNQTIYSKDKKADDSVYTDRLHQWDYKKHNELLKKHFGNQSQHWDNRDPKKIEAFLNDYYPNMGCTFEVVKIMEHKRTDGNFIYSIHFIKHKK